MDQSIILMDPTAELSPAVRERLPRMDNLQGKTVGLLDISKARGDIFLDRLSELLEEKDVTVNRYKKPTFSRIAPVELKQKIVSECDVVIEGLADWGSCTSCSVHDISDLEKLGVVGMFVASEEFVAAKQAQADALGFDPAAVFVEHPIQDRTDDEMRIIADNAFDQIISALTT